MLIRLTPKPASLACPMTTPRRHSQIRSLLATLAVAVPVILIGSGLLAPPAQAAYIVTLAQVGSDVVATGSGTIDLTGVVVGPLNGSLLAFINPSVGDIFAGPAIFTPVDYYGFVTGPTSFGSGSGAVASSGSGDLVGIGEGEDVYVPAGYSSGASLSDSATWDNTTFSMLGVTPGTYVWSWGSGANADSFTLETVSVPAPVIGEGLSVVLAVCGVLFGAKLLERG